MTGPPEEERGLSIGAGALCALDGSSTPDDAERSCGMARGGGPDGGPELDDSEWFCSDGSKGVFYGNGHFSYGSG
jgi:hypothetical protein